MKRRVSAYAIAAMIGAALLGAGFGPLRCGIYGFSGGLDTTLAGFLIALAIGAIVGIAVAGAVDLAMNLPYVLTNRAEAKRRRAAQPIEDATD